MLDFNHPQARWIMAAAREHDAVLRLARLMTLLPTPQRQQLLPRVDRHIGCLHRFNREHFQASPALAHAIAELEAGCQRLANLESTESRLGGVGDCPVCGSPITDLRDLAEMVYCSTCLQTLQPARQLLEGPGGFGFEAI